MQRSHRTQERLDHRGSHLEITPYLNHLKGTYTMATVLATGPRLITLTPNRTYASAENAVRAVLKVFPADAAHCSNLTYFLQRTADDRFFPVFVGERALHAGAHMHFNCIN